MEKCPHCQATLKPWNIKAECPKCKANIPNYNWEERLDKDSEIAESCFIKLHKTMAAFKYSFVGTKLRIARIPVSVLPLFGFLFPLGKAAINLPFCSESTSLNAVTIIKALVNLDFNTLFKFIGSELTRESALLFASSVFLLIFSVLSLLVSLGFLMFNFKKLNSKGLFVTNLAAAMMLAAGGVCFSRFFTSLGSIRTAFNGNVSFGLYIAIGLFLASSLINLAVALNRNNYTANCSDSQNEIGVKVSETTGAVTASSL